MLIYLNSLFLIFLWLEYWNARNEKKNPFFLKDFSYFFQFMDDNPDIENTSTSTVENVDEDLNELIPRIVM